MKDVNKCGGWNATFHSERYGSGELKVHGECTFPTPGFKVHLEKKSPQGINPAILLLEKIVEAPTGIEPQRVVTIPVSFAEHTNTQYDEVQILPDGTRIEVKQTGKSELTQGA
jgi:hypothetical protein